MRDHFLLQFPIYWRDKLPTLEMTSVTGILSGHLKHLSSALQQQEETRKSLTTAQGTLQFIHTGMISYCSFTFVCQRPRVRSVFVCLSFDKF